MKVQGQLEGQVAALSSRLAATMSELDQLRASSGTSLGSIDALKRQLAVTEEEASDAKQERDRARTALQASEAALEKEVCCPALLSPRVRNCPVMCAPRLEADAARG